MKKIAIILLSILVAGMFVACNQDVTIDAQTYANMELGTFVLNGNNYATLQAAIDALSTPKAIGNEPGVIYLTKDASGPGAVIDGVPGVKIDFGEFTYSFTNVTATQGSTDGNFGLAIKGGSSVTLAGTKAMNLFDNTSGLTMVYVEGAGTSLAVEQAPQMSVADDQFVFWAADGATLTIGGETKVSGSIAATGTSTATPKVIVTESAAIAVPEMKTENAAVLLNSSGATEVAKVSATDTQVVVTGTGDVAVDSVGTSSGLNVQNLSGNIVTIGDDSVSSNEQTTITDGKASGATPADPDAAEDIIKNLPIFESGKGKEDDPYIIKTAAQLELFRDSVNYSTDYKGEYIKLDSDITLSGVWTPIGNSYRKQSKGPVFRGNFDGDGHTITGLTNEGFTGFACNIENEYVYGLFGVVENATIVNLNLTDVYIEEPDGLIGDNVGALIGYGAYNLYVENCHVLGGSIEGTDAVGGLVGRAYGEDKGMIVIKDCSNAATVTGVKKTGGIGGYLHPTNLSEEATESGILGIGNCKNTGDVTSVEQGAAGIACFSFNKNYCDIVYILDNTNTGAVSNTQNRLASIAYNVGENDYDHSSEAGEKYDTYKIVGNINTGSVAEGTVLVTKYAQQVIGDTNYEEFNETTNWFDGGEGTKEYPYQIASEATLKFFRDRVNSGYSGEYYVLTDDITLTEAWTPIGTSDYPFTGTFDGSKRAIKNLTISDDKGTQLAFFKYSKGATFKDINFENASITAKEDGAVLLGYAYGDLNIDNVNIDSNSHVSGTKKVAGLVGTIDNRVGNGGTTSITNCTTAASVTAESRVGAIVANIYCWNTPSDGSENFDTFNSGHLYYFDKCINSGSLSETGSGTSGVGLVSYINQGTVYGGYKDTYLIQESFVFKNCVNDFSKMSISKVNGNKGYYIGTYTNAGRIVLEKDGESYSNEIIGGLSKGRYIIKINEKTYGFRSDTGDDGIHLPSSIEEGTVDLGQVITTINQAEAIAHFVKTSGYNTSSEGYIEAERIYIVSDGSALFDDQYDLYICDGFLAISNSKYDAYVEPYIEEGKTTNMTHSESSTSEYTYEVVDGGLY